MRELNMNEIEQVSGGFWQFSLGLFGGLAVEGLTDAITGRSASQWISDAYSPVNPHVAYYDRGMYISP